jgi:hypothetical protein
VTTTVSTEALRLHGRDGDLLQQSASMLGADRDILGYVLHEYDSMLKSPAARIELGNVPMYVHAAFVRMSVLITDLLPDRSGALPHDRDRGVPV